MAPARKFWALSLAALAIAGLIRGILPQLNILSTVQATIVEDIVQPYIQGPFTGQTVSPAIYNGDLRDLPQIPPMEFEIPMPPGIPGEADQEEPSDIIPPIDPVAQVAFAHGQMPEPVMNFDGLNFSDGGERYPPDANGDVGPHHYIQVVKVAIGIFDKATGERLVNMSYDAFFQGPPDSPCDDRNKGDVLVLYDPIVDRWIVTDFTLPGPNSYECIAVSQTGDPVSGGWYYYALQANSRGFASYWNDYPKLAVWSDGWYMSANMFSRDGNEFGGVRVWALDREDALVGAPIDLIYFDCTSVTHCSSLLPANLRGDPPPSGSAEYFANLVSPDRINIWHFHTHWSNPADSRFTGPIPLKVAAFSTYLAVPQKEAGIWKLDSLGDRLMNLLQYRNINGSERLYANHSVATGEVGGIRWYEILIRAEAPTLLQQGTYQPDDSYRWMGSIAADHEGNIAVGYSVSSTELFPAIRYAGRLAGETPNLLTQNEASLIEGSGSQVGSNRWGDYSSMAVDPLDGCTFWYTQEYMKETGPHWDTRIGSFRFPSCGQLKGTIQGYVYDAGTHLLLSEVPVLAIGSQYTFSTLSDVNGFYTMDLIAGIYEVAAGPLAGYPQGVTASLTVTPPGRTDQDFTMATNPLPEGTFSLDQVLP
jgi:hypothetical protein